MYDFCLFSLPYLKKNWFSLSKFLKRTASIGLEQFIGKDSLIPTILLFLEYGLAMASSTYCLTFFFSEHSMAQVSVLKNIWRFVTCGILLILISFLCAECGPPRPIFHWPHSYGSILHNGTYKFYNTLKFSAQGWKA